MFCKCHNISGSISGRISGSIKYYILSKMSKIFVTNVDKQTNQPTKHNKNKNNKKWKSTVEYFVYFVIE